MPDIVADFKNIRDNIYCRVIVLYANAEDAEIIFDYAHRYGMNQSDYVWIVSEQVTFLDIDFSSKKKTFSYCDFIPIIMIVQGTRSSKSIRRIIISPLRAFRRTIDDQR